MGWVWIIAAAWVLLGVGLAWLIGRSIVLADRKAAEGPRRIGDRPPPPPALLPTTAGPQRAATVRDLPVPRPPVGRPPAPLP